MAKSGPVPRSFWRALAAAAALSASCAPLLAYDPPPTYSIPGGTFFDKAVTYQRDDDHFKYGSLGGERGYKGQIGFGLPYWIWVAMPELFPEYLPDRKPGQGLKAFGYIYEKGRDPRFQLPIGTSQRRNLGIDRVWINCGVCHTGTVRETPESPPRIILGMPANRYNQGAWVRFLFAAASDERFNADNLLRKIRELEKERRRLIAEGKLAGGTYLPPDLGPLDEWIYHRLVIPAMKDRLLGLRSRLAFIQFETWGPGRVDTFNAPKALLNFPMDRAPEAEKIGNADLPSVWYQKAREGLQLHWDGNNTSVQERNLSAAFAAAMPTTLDKCSLRRVARYLETLAPPPFPASRIDHALAERGKPIYAEVCARCHGAPSPPFRAEGVGERVGTVVPLERIGTDPARFNSYTPELAKAQNLLYAGFPLGDSRECPGDPGAKEYPARFTHFRKTEGYASSPLDGLWLRAPYLHNGSVPSLRALLEPSARRPARFWIGYDVYDYKDVGFVTQGPAAEAEGWLYDTTRPANGNQGHEGKVYGTELSGAEKDALIEYLKTF
jgi:hypothetical protein